MDMIINRLSHYADIGATQFQTLSSLSHRIETRQAGEDIVIEGEVVDYVFIIESGWAIRYRLLDDGRRQIMNFMLPGDCFDLMSLTKSASDHNVSAASEVVLRRIKATDFFNAIRGDSCLSLAFWWVAIQEEAILREQIVRNGRLSAKERLGNLILELNRRLSISTGRQDNSVAIPVTQNHLADALGLSSVHISRSMGKLSREGYIAVESWGIQILNRDALAEMAEFDDRYLQTPKLSF
ncbi:Crp/Fnr family transcriptional regulator [Fretibacter rubidus]|uniref:Crp/Fnr family transcriptional regulator n=1 Tax=Fretibacter rubidus TaxID=570162 RepID=UPI00352A8C51